MAFIKYTEIGRSYAAKASISKSGMLSLSNGARKRFNLDQHKFCVLYYDPDTRRVGIELIDDENADGARKIRLRSTGADIAVKSFIDFFDLGIRETMLYTVERDDGSGLLTIELGAGKKRGGQKSRQGQIDG